MDGQCASRRVKPVSARTARRAEPPRHTYDIHPSKPRLAGKAWNARFMDAIKLLRAGHYQTRDLLEDLCDTDMDARQVRSDLLAQITESLEAHARIENEIFFPAFEDVAEREGDLALVHEAV